MEQSINVWLLLAIGVAHFVGDFVLQTDWQAKNKARNIEALLAHTATYGVTLGLLAIVFGLSWLWVVVNYLLHTATDAITSQGTRYFSRQDPPQWHNFFVIVGFDQLLHYATLVGSLFLLGVL